MPEIYQRKMWELLGDLEGILIYMDDVIVFGMNQTEHDSRLKEVLEKIMNAGLKLNKEKCEFSRSKLEFLGNIISSEGISVSPDKVEAVKKLKIPNNVHELRRMLGLFNFVTKFFHNAQINLSPLNNLLKKENCWQWGYSQQKAFDEIKKSLSTAPALAYFEENKEIVVSADASAYAVGGVLLQRHGDVLRPVAYCSRSLTKS